MAGVKWPRLLSQENINELMDGLDDWSPEFELDKVAEEQPVVGPDGLPEEEEEGDGTDGISASTDSNPGQQEATEGDNKEVTVKVQAA